MRFELTGSDFNELLASGTDGALPLAETRAWPAPVGTGTFGCIEIRPGVILYLLSLAPAIDVRLTATPGRGYLECSYHLRGHAVGTVDGARHRISAGEGQQLAVIAPPGHGGTVEFEPRNPIVTVALCVAPTALAELLPTPETSRTERWHGAIAQQRPEIEAPRPLSVDRRRAVEQIIGCPFTGSARQLFLESKALELLACEIGEHGHAASPDLPADDEARVRAAAELLIARVDDPLSLRALARAVGTNEFKLKRGFRHVFGTTVFGYLRTHRLRAAHDLLAGAQVSVMEAATRVGYACPSRFADAFRHEFGRTPSSLRRSPRKSACAR